MAVKCIDVSDHQGKINWTKVKKAGVEVAIIRAGYGKNNTDEYWKKNIEGAIKAGIKHIGVYWFSYAYTLTMAVNEANYCYEHCKPYLDKIDFGIWFDWEYASMNYAKKMKHACGRQRITDMHKAFCERIKALGIVPGFYYNYDFKKNYIDLSQLPYLNWYALGKSNGEFKSVAIQQYGTEKVAGIKDKVDANWVFTDVSKVAVPTAEEAASTKTDGIPNIPKRGYFKQGDEGPEVEWIQKKLNRALKITDTKVSKELGLQLTVNGKFDAKTAKNLKLFQDITHLKKDAKAGVASLTKLNTIKITKPHKAVVLAVAICRNNDYAYGTGSRAHHNGCPFCGTNRTGKKKAKKGSKWDDTLCCNPFCHVSYAHGAGIKKMLTDCDKNKQGGLDTKSWKVYGFSVVGKCKNVSYDNLKKGDLILFEDHHIYMHTGKTGKGWLAEASGGTWDDSSIAHKQIGKKRYKSYAKKSSTYVLRYTGK